jgi:antitoxin component YwqK of YwqJK toxin-antitoxin module
LIRIAFAIAITFNLYSAHANLGTYKHGKLINPDTNKPYTGNIEVLNNDWGKVEFSKDYLNGHLHSNERVFYQSDKLKSLGHFNKGVLTGTVEFYYEDGSIQARVNFNNGNKQGRAISYNPSAGPAPVISMYESS